MDKCHICGNKNLLVLKFPRNFKFIFSNSKPSQEHKVIGYCNSCNLSVTVISEKFKKEINKNYINYLDNNDSDSVLKVFNKKSDGLNRTSIIINYLKKFLDLKKKNKVIDIGAGNGNLIYELSKYNQVNIDAFDLSSKYINKLKNLNGFNNFYSGSIDKIRGEYDLVILSHVIEHIISPKTFLEKIKKIIKKDKFIFFQMPDLLNKPFDYFLYDHVTNFSLSSFEQLLKSVGYDVIHISNSLIKGELTCIAKLSIKKTTVLEKCLFKQYSKKHELLIDFFNYIGNIPDSNKIIIYGTGNIGCWISTVINNWKGYFVDDDINKQNTIFLNKKVLKPSFGKKILIPFDRNRVKEILKKNNIKATKNIFYYGKI